MIEGQYRFIAFASCTLSTSQRNYSQIEKEAFSIIFSLKRFHQFLTGRCFTIITDDRPLLSLFAPDKAVPMHTAARLQRSSLILSSYKYEYSFGKLPSTWMLIVCLVYRYCLLGICSQIMLIVITWTVISLLLLHVVISNKQPELILFYRSCARWLAICS